MDCPICGCKTREFDVYPLDGHTLGVCKVCTSVFSLSPQSNLIMLNNGSVMDTLTGNVLEYPEVDDSILIDYNDLW